MKLSDANLELIRKRPQSTELFLSVFQPRAVLKCRVNSVGISKGARLIPFDGISFGADTAIEAGMLLCVGSAEGLKDIGKTRIKSIMSGTITVAENSDIDWQDDQFLTAYRYFEVLPVYPRIIQNPANDEQVIFYKDYDTEYTDQNSILGTFVNMGSHRAAQLEGGSALLWYTSSGTSHMITGTVLSYDWSFEGGTPTGSTDANPGWISYDTPGHYVTRLIVTGASGSVDTSYRYVSIYNPISSGTSLPFQKWSLDSLSGSRDEGGYTASITLYETASVIEEGSVVVLFSKDYYGSTEISLGGNQENNSEIFFVGYVLDGSVQYDYEKSTVKFDLGSVTRYIQQMLGFAVSVESKQSPATWTELLNMDMKRAIYHYLRWHSTVLSTTDIQYRGENPYVQFYDSDRSSVYDAIDNFMRSAIVGRAVTDRQGRVYIEPDITTATTGTAQSVMQITNRDWRNAPDIDELLIPEMSYLERGGIQHIPTGSTFGAFMSCAPGEAPGYRGEIDQVQGLALNSQDHLNQIVGNLYAFRNYPYKSIDEDLAGSYRNLDIAPQESVNIVILPEDTNRGLDINGDFNPNSLSYEYDPLNKMLLARATFIPIVNGTPGEFMTIPDVPEDPASTFPRYPTIPPFPTGSIWGGGIGSPGSFVIADIEEQAISTSSYRFVMSTTLRGNGTAWATVIQEWPDYNYTAIRVSGGWYHIELFLEISGALDGYYTAHVGTELAGDFKDVLTANPTGGVQIRLSTTEQYPKDLGYWAYLINNLCTVPVGVVGGTVKGSLTVAKLT